VWLRRVSKQWVELFCGELIFPLAGRVLSLLESVICGWASLLSSRVVAFGGRLSFTDLGSICFGG
jgi:hypothetical protein